MELNWTEQYLENSVNGYLKVLDTMEKMGGLVESLTRHAKNNTDATRTLELAQTVQAGIETYNEFGSLVSTWSEQLQAYTGKNPQELEIPDIKKLTLKPEYRVLPIETIIARTGVSLK